MVIVFDEIREKSVEAADAPEEHFAASTLIECSHIEFKVL